MCKSAGVIISLIILWTSSLVGAGAPRPIIGIMCHEWGEPPECFIAASYVKAVEAAGARVAPIFIGREPDYYRRMVKNLNGVVFPGGEANETTRGGYFDAGAQIFSLARKWREMGDHFPILGVCLGLEFLALYSNGLNRSTTLEECSGEDGRMQPLSLAADYRESSLYSSARPDVIRILKRQNVTANYHSWCLRPETKLQIPWRILSTNKDGDGKTFVSSMETEGPIVAIQFHPEKNAYEWEEHNPSYKDALIANRHFYDWLVTEARKNGHFFTNKTEEQDSLIYNYSPTYTGKTGDIFTQTYIFKKP